MDLPVTVHLFFLQIKNCYTYFIDAEVFKDLVNLDYLAFEGGAIDWLEPDAMTGLSVERLDYESHTFPQTLGHFETRNCEFNIKYVPPGFLFNWKNLTSVTFRVCNKLLFPLSRNVGKRTFGYVRHAKIQISLHMRRLI